MSTIKTRGQRFCQNAKLVRFDVSIMQTKHIGMTASKRSKDLLFLQSGENHLITYLMGLRISGDVGNVNSNSQTNFYFARNDVSLLFFDEN